ncbi:MAG: protein-L-isoaspartate O-methyltransferase [Actinomycetota bacterium]|nr:protein-L-isoaspartate O-methyltransferase [Actinomycetota bacterium]
MVGPQHQALVDDLCRHGSITSAGLRAAMLQVDRRAFVPAAAAGEAYADAPVMLQVDAGGRAISTVSQPTMVALMLEQLQVRRGDHVLEIGTASGYNAALLAALAGAEGEVVTIELDEELARLAARRIASSTNVVVVVDDGRLGHPVGAPYQRIIVTAGAEAVAPAWHDQLAEGGRLVVPLPDRDAREVCMTFEKAGGALVELARMPCRFVPLRTRP